MKTMQKILIIILLAIFPVLIIAQDKSKNVQTIKFSTSIDCASCVNKIMTNLPQEKGIKDVNCDLKTKEVSVAYQKDKNSAEEIQKSLEKLGFTAKPVKKSEAIPEKDK
jgi:mercuric ion binding protein